MTATPLRIAHRGMPRLARENTLASFALAIESGADGIELDVHATLDGIVVVNHDPAVVGGLRIAEVPFATLRAHASAAAASIPTLQEVCDLVEDQAMLFVEVKGAGIEHAVLEVMSRHPGRFAVHSFDHALIARIHVIDPTLRLGVLFEQAPADVEELMDATGARDVWPHVPLIEFPLVDRVHGAGGRVIAWTVNDPVTATRLATVGVDGLCGDDVRIFPQRQ